MDGERTEFETGTAKDSPDISQTVRRSSRTSHPPQRFGEQKFLFWFCFLYHPLWLCLTCKLKRDDCNVLAYLIWFYIHACVADY